jgi:hypothetical protein
VNKDYTDPIRQSCVNTEPIDTVFFIFQCQLTQFFQLVISSSADVHIERYADSQSTPFAKINCFVLFCFFNRAEMIQNQVFIGSGENSISFKRRR